MNCQPARLEAREREDDDVAHYWREGYAVVRGLFGRAEIRAIAAAVDEIHDEALAHGRCFRHGNLFYDVATNEDGAPLVRMAQWPSWRHPALDAVRLDRRIAAVLAPLIGGDLKQIINQLHWKARGSLSDFAWHQDSRFRQPARAFRDLGGAYVQTGLAIDPHTPESGCLRLVPRSHLRGDLGLDVSTVVLGTAMNDSALAAAGLSADEADDLVLDPGDLALWSPYLVHASGENRSRHRRRLYINGYVRARDCDRGEWAFRAGEPVPLGREPALVHYEALRERPEPHYPEPEPPGRG